MALSKTYTRKALKDIIVRSLDILDSSNDIDSLLNDYLNFAVSEIAELLADAKQPDYGFSEVIAFNDDTVATVFGGSGTTFVQSTKVLTTPTGGGFTFIPGQLLIGFESGDFQFSFGKVVSVSTVGLNYVVVTSLDHADSSALQFLAHPVYDFGTPFDLQDLTKAIDRVIKLVSSTSGLIPEKKLEEFEYLSGLSTRQNSLFFAEFGQKLYLFKGSDVASTGTITIYYYRLPTPMTADSDYIDIKDKYIPLVTAKAKQYVLEQKGKTAPESLTQIINSKTIQISQLNNADNAAAQNRK